MPSALCLRHRVALQAENRFFSTPLFFKALQRKKNLLLMATRRQGVAFHRQGVGRCTGQRQQELVEG
jgi:hypothetical protein